MLVLRPFLCYFCQKSTGITSIRWQLIYYKKMIKKEEQHRVIKKIEESCVAGRCDDDSFLIELEHVYNSFTRKNFLSKRNNKEISLALDDDKHHFIYSKNCDTHGLKRSRHIKDN